MVSSGGFISLESSTQTYHSVYHTPLYIWPFLPLSWCSVSICSPLSSSGEHWSMLEAGVSVSWLTNLLMLSRSSVSSHVHIQHTHAAAAYEHKCRNKLDRRKEEHSATNQPESSRILATGLCYYLTVLTVVGQPGVESLTSCVYILYTLSV